MAGLSRRLSAILAVDLAYANCAPILRGVLNVFIPKHKLKQNQTTRTLQATFFASWRITSTFPFCILESLCLLWWLLNNRSLQAGSIIYGPGAICLFNWAGFLQQKARKKNNQPTNKKLAIQRCRRKNGSQEHSTSLAPRTISASLQAVWNMVLKIQPCMLESGL